MPGYRELTALGEAVGSVVRRGALSAPNASVGAKIENIQIGVLLGIFEGRIGIWAGRYP
jgi:hypothetical protein